MEQQRYFTLDEANQQVPWLETQLQSIASVRAEMARLRPELEGIVRKGRTNGHSGVDQEIANKRKGIDAVADRLAQLLQEVHDSGIILRDPERGLVDFPALWESREVYLCWLLGESEVQFWHEVDTGFAGRQPL